MGNDLLTDTFCELQKKLQRVAGRMLQDEMEAEDAVQDTFCNLWTKDLPQTSDETRFKLFAVLKNVCLNKIKRRRPTQNLDALDIPAESVDNIDVERLKSELQKHLSPYQYEIFRLSVYEEMEYEEIAEHMGLSVEAVRMHMCRARKILRDKYKQLKP